jgi:hypothetical protein
VWPRLPVVLVVGAVFGVIATLLNTPRSAHARKFVGACAAQAAPRGVLLGRDTTRYLSLVGLARHPPGRRRTLDQLPGASTGDYVLDDCPLRVASLVVNSGAAWAGAGVLGGWLLRSASRGPVGGPVALIAAVIAYYLLGAVVGSENPDGSADQIVAYSLMAVAAGPMLGAVGGLIHRPGPLGLFAALVVPLGICAEWIWRSSRVELPPDPARSTADIVLLTFAAAGATAAAARYLSGRRRVRAGG